MLHPKCLRAADGGFPPKNPIRTPRWMAILEPLNKAYYVKKSNPVRQSRGPEWGMNVIAGKPLSGLNSDLINKYTPNQVFKLRRNAPPAGWEGGIAYAGREGR